MRIGTISAIALCLVAYAVSPVSAGQHGRPHTTPSAQHGQSAQHGTTAQHGSTRTPHTTPTTTTTTTTTTNRIAAKISSHPQQLARVQHLLPAGMTLESASSGFRNQGQFIAALHVSRNLNIPFADLKSRMTGAHPMSLGQAIQDLRPSANATAESRRAHHQASSDLR